MCAADQSLGLPSVGKVGEFGSKTRMQTLLADQVCQEGSGHR